MEVRQLEYVVALSDERSFSRAAERMRVAQPSLSQQIKKLEKELGQTLFDRLPRGAVPTEAGKRLVQRARLILAQLVDAGREVSDTKNSVAGQLRVGAIPTIAPYLLPQLLHEFRARYPDADVHVVEDVTERLCHGVIDGDIDIAVTSSVDDDRAMHVELIGKERLWALVGADHPLASRKSVTWKTFGKEPAVMLDDANCLAGQVSDLCTRNGVMPKVTGYGAQLTTLASMVALGLGISVVPEMMRVMDNATDRVYLPFKGEKPTRDICVIWGLLRYRTNAARAFEDLVREYVAA